MTTRRPTREQSTPSGDHLRFLATLLSMAIYSVPWFVLQWRWPMFLQPGEQSLPPLAVTLGLGIGWFVAAVVLLAIVVPNVLARGAHAESARRWRQGAIHAAWFGLVVTSVSAGMRLPLSPSLRVISTLALVVIEVLAVRWLARRGTQSVGHAARPGL
jgi:hypothetical protein